LAFAFGAGATLLYAGGMARHGVAGGWRLLVASVLLFLSCCSKESALAWVVFPVVYVLVLRLRADPKASIRAELFRQAPRAAWSLGVPFLLWLVLWILLLREHGKAFDVAYQANPLYQLGILERFPSGVMVLGYGLYKLFWPFFLVSDYGGPVFGLPEGWLGGRFLVALVVLLSVLVGGLLAARRWPLLFLAMASFLGFTFITSNILLPIETVFGERLLYAAVLAQGFLVAWAGGAVARHRAVAVGLGLVLAAWLVACFCLGHQRTYDWKNNETLFITDAEKLPLSSAMNTNAARVYRLKEDWENWEKHIRIAMEHDPESAIPYNEMGVTLSTRKQYAEAEEYLNKALRARRIELPRDGPSIYMNLANVMVQTGRPEKAKECWRQALKIDSGFWMARHQLLVRAYDEDDETAAMQLIQAGDPGPGHPDHALYDMHRGMWAHKKNEHVAAVALLRPALQKLHARGIMEMPAWLALARSLIQAGALGEARVVVDGLLNQRPEPRAAAELMRMQRDLRRQR
ncbi:MAG: tetratricopeptide repeat protein, partial [Planctomycetota bacterium]